MTSPSLCHGGITSEHVMAHLLGTVTLDGVAANGTGQCADGLRALANLTYNSCEVSLRMLSASSLQVNGAGDYSACERVGNVARYCSLQLRATADESAVLDTQALCAPAACTSDELLKLLPGAFPPGSGSFTIACVGADAAPLNVGGILALLAFAILTLLVVSATCIDLTEQQPCTKPFGTLSDPLVPLEAEAETETNAGDTDPRLLGWPLNISNRPQPTLLLPLGRPRDLLLAFSARANLTQLTATSKSRGFTALEGVRVLCMLWIVVGHTANFMEFLGFDEPLQAVERRLLDSAAFQVPSRWVCGQCGGGGGGGA